MTMSLQLDNYFVYKEIFHNAQNITFNFDNILFILIRNEFDMKISNQYP